MKSVIKNEEEQQKGEYPCLKTHEDAGYVVLFTSEFSGIVLTTSDYYDIGESSMNWNEEEFKPFNGTITLSN